LQRLLRKISAFVRAGSGPIESELPKNFYNFPAQPDQIRHIRVSATTKTAETAELAPVGGRENHCFSTFFSTVVENFGG